MTSLCELIPFASFIALCAIVLDGTINNLKVRRAKKRIETGCCEHCGHRLSSMWDFDTNAPSNPYCAGCGHNMGEAYRVAGQKPN